MGYCADDNYDDDFDPGCYSVESQAEEAAYNIMDQVETAAMGASVYEGDRIRMECAIYESLIGLIEEKIAELKG